MILKTKKECEIEQQPLLNYSRLIPLHRHDMLRLQTGSVHQQALQALRSLEKRLQSGASDFVAIIHGQALELDAVGAECVDVRVVDEVYAVQVDDAEIWGRGLQLVHVDDFLKVIRKLAKLRNRKIFLHKFLLLPAQSSRTSRLGEAPRGH